MGNISLGLALVAGKKRVPKPATGKMALVIFLFLITIKAPYSCFLRHLVKMLALILSDFLF